MRNVSRQSLAGSFDYSHAYESLSGFLLVVNRVLQRTQAVQRQGSQTFVRSRRVQVYTTMFEGRV